MNSIETQERIERIGIIPAIRLSTAPDALFAAEAIVDSGIPILEVTMTVPGALEVIAELARNNSDLVVGAGTVLDLDVARRCVDAGAKFLTSPGLDLEILDFARKQQVLIFPGVLTPSEVGSARKAGAGLVKVFPCSQLGGPDYIRALKSPYPDLSLIASGGVNQQTAGAFIQAGAVALGIGRDLIQPDAIKHRERGWIRELAQRFLWIVAEARAHH